MRRIRDFLTNCEGASMVEYAFLVSLIAMVVFVSVSALGLKLPAYYTKVSNGLG